MLKFIFLDFQMFSFILMFFYTIGIVINGLVILVILSIRKMRKSSMNMLLLNLALSDLCLLSVNSLYLSPKLFEHYRIKFKFSTIYCCFHTFTTGVCGLVSILTYMLICVERYIVIVCPLHATFWCARSRILLIISAFWAFSTMYRLPYFDLAGANKVKYGCFIEFLPFHWVSEFVLVHVSVFMVSSTLYYRTCKVLWSLEILGYSQLNENKIRERRKLLKVLILCFVLYFLCSFGSILLFIICELFGFDILRYAIRLFTIQSAINPFLYALIGKQFRENFFNFFARFRR